MPTEESKSSKPLPKTPPGGMLNGAVRAQYKRCGKKTCRCARGELHGPYFYRFKWHDGRVVKIYVRLSDVGEVRAACARYRKMQKELSEGRRHCLALSSRLRLTLGGVDDE